MEHPIYLSAEECERLLDTGEVLDLVKETLLMDEKGRVSWPEPPNLSLAPDERGNHYHVKACVLEDLALGGVRVVVHPEDESTGATRWVILVDARTARPIAIIDDRWNYAQRTVAAVILVARELSQPHVDSIALLGAGRLARASLPYLAKLFPGAAVRIASRRERTRRALAEWAAAGLDVAATPASLETAAEGAQVILSCTGSTDPVLEDAWVQAGSVTACLETGECGRDLYFRADLRIVDSLRQLEGELRGLYGNEAPGLVDGSMGEVVTGDLRRTAAEQRILIISQGVVSHDVMLAGRAYEQAVNRGMGKMLPIAFA